MVQGRQMRNVDQNHRHTRCLLMASSKEVRHCCLVCLLQERLKDSVERQCHHTICRLAGDLLMLGATSFSQARLEVKLVRCHLLWCVQLMASIHVRVTRWVLKGYIVGLRRHLQRPMPHRLKRSGEDKSLGFVRCHRCGKEYTSKSTARSIRVDSVTHPLRTDGVRPMGSCMSGRCARRIGLVLVIHWRWIILWRCQTDWARSCHSQAVGVPDALDAASVSEVLCTP